MVSWATFSLTRSRTSLGKMCDVFMKVHEIIDLNTNCSTCTLDWWVSEWSRSVVSDSFVIHPVDCRLPGFSIHRILQARMLDWVSISFSRGPFWPRDRIQVSCIVGRRFAVWAAREAHNGLMHATKMLDWRWYSERVGTNSPGCFLNHKYLYGYDHYFENP